MKDNLKHILAILAAAILLLAIGYFVGNSLFNKPAEVIRSSSNTKTVTTEEIKTAQNTFTVEQVGQIKKVLTDSLRNVYGSIINRLREGHTSPFDFAQGDTLSVTDGEINEISNYSYISEVDSEFVVKDDSGSVTDLLDIKSTFISHSPLDTNSVHLVKVNHTSFRKKIKTVTQIQDSIFVKEPKSFWERFTISPNISAGYGLFNKQFDIYTGIGLNFEFNAFEIFYSNKK